MRIKQICLSICRHACACVLHERERDQNQDFTVLQKWISFFRYVTNITANVNKKISSKLISKVQTYP